MRCNQYWLVLVSSCCILTWPQLLSSFLLLTQLFFASIWDKTCSWWNRSRFLTQSWKKLKDERWRLFCLVTLVWSHGRTPTRSAKKNQPEMFCVRSIQRADRLIGRGWHHVGGPPSLFNPTVKTKSLREQSEFTREIKHVWSVHVQSPAEETLNSYWFFKWTEAGSLCCHWCSEETPSFKKANDHNYKIQISFYDKNTSNTCFFYWVPL